MSELSKRIFSAVPAVIVIIGLTWVGGPYFYAAVIILVLFLTREICLVTEKAGFKPTRSFAYVIALWIILIPILPYDFEIGIGLFLLYSAWNVVNKRETHVREFIATIFCAGYGSFGLLFLKLLRNTGSDRIGFMLIVSLFLMVWGNDICAYFGGKAFGKHSLSPAISPGKTTEGAFLGIIGSVIGLIIAIYAVPYSFAFSWPLLLPAALLVSIFSPVGDLAESKLKRAAGLKDSSDLIPGHGGLFDRFDGLILAAPVFYLYVHCLSLSGYALF